MDREPDSQRIGRGLAAGIGIALGAATGLGNQALEVGVGVPIGITNRWNGGG